MDNHIKVHLIWAYKYITMKTAQYQSWENDVNFLIFFFKQIYRFKSDY